MMNRQQQINDALVAQGSQTYEYECGILVHDTLYWYHMEDIFPEARIFLPFDSLEVVNNSGVTIRFYINSAAVSYSLLAYMIKPLGRIPFRQIGIKNMDAANDTAAGEVIFHVRRLPPNVQIVQSTNLLR